MIWPAVAIFALTVSPGIAADTILLVTPTVPIPPGSDADKAALREAFKTMGLPDNATVRFHVHVQKPNDFDTIRKLPQVKKDAEFHRDAVEFLKSVGFSQVLLAVDVSSVIHTSLYK